MWLPLLTVIISVVAACEPVKPTEAPGNKCSTDIPNFDVDLCASWNALACPPVNATVVPDPISGELKLQFGCTPLDFLPNDAQIYIAFEKTVGYPLEQFNKEYSVVCQPDNTWKVVPLEYTISKASCVFK